jgi:1-acyl-sn-glycerol-3-phosphate acyltransferase
MSNQKPLLFDKRFWPVFWTQFSGAFNDNVFKNALVILIAYKSFTLLGLSPELMVALCGAIFILPFFLFSAIAGQISDKYPKHKLMVIIKVWEVLVMLIGASGFLLENIHILMTSLFLMGLQSTFFGPVKYSILPELIDDDELIGGNALVEMGTFIAILVGTILGGVLIGMEDVGSKYVSVVVIILAIIGTLFSMKVRKLEPTNPDLKLDIGLIKPTYDIIKLTKNVKSVWLAVLGISWFWLVGAVLLSIFPVYVKNILNGPETVVTLFLALFSIGVAIGSILCEKMSRGHLELGLVPVGSIGMTIFLIDLFLIGTPSFVSTTTETTIPVLLSHFSGVRLLFDLLMFSIFSGFFTVPLYTFIQHRGESESMSRVIAGNNIMNALFMVAGSIMLMVIFAVGLSSVDVFIILAIVNCFVAFYIYTVLPEFMWRLVCVLLTRLIYRYEVKGLENIPDSGPAILVCNHVSFVDWLVISAAVKRPARFVMHYSFMTIPIAKYFFKGAKVIPIAGRNEKPEMIPQAFDKVSEELRNGEIVCVFPEGEITRDGKLTYFRAGIEKIIERDQVPVIPLVLKGFWGTFFSRKFGKAGSKPSQLIKDIFSKIELDIGESIAAKDVTAKALEDYTRKKLEE